MISKELLSLVLGIEVLKCIEPIDGFIKYEIQEGITVKIGNLNLDTLTRLCKEWCLEQGYMLNTSIDFYNNGICELISNEHDITPLEGNTELEAVIKATEWVVKERD